MKNTMFSALSLLLLVVLAVPACDWFKKKAPEAAAEVKEAQEPKLRLVDVNTEEVYADAHIPGAIHTSVDRVGETAKDWNKETPVVVYCSDYKCRASDSAAKKLTELGFKDVRVYQGGVHEWVKLAKENKAAYPYEGSAKAEHFQKEVAKEAAPEGTRTISAEDLSKLVEEAKK